MFSDKVKKALIEAGWSPERKVDTTKYEKVLLLAGYSIPKNLKNFLSEFGGLYLKCPQLSEFAPQLLKRRVMIHKKNLYKIIHFNVIEAIGEPIVFMTKEEIFEPRIGEEMIAFGEIWDGRYWLAMTPSGKVYARDVDSILFLGNNYEEMLENEFHHVRPIEIP